MTEEIWLSHAAVQVAALARKIGKSELGRRVGISEGMVRHLATGRKNPGPELKEKFEALGIERAAWTVPMAPGITEKTTPAVERVAAKVARERQADESAIQRLERSVIEYGEKIEVYEATIDVLIKDDAAHHAISAMAKRDGAMAKRDAVLVDLAKLYGEGELTAAAIHRSRVWNDEILPKILAILKKHPEAARDFAEAMARPE